MKALAKVLRYEGLLLTGLALLVVFLAPDMFLRFWFLLLLGPVALIAGFLMDVGTAGAALRKRTAKYGINAVVFSVVVVGIIVFVNLIAADIDKSWDGTSAKVNTLSDQTKKALQNIDGSVLVTAFFMPAEAQTYERLLKRYREAAPEGRFAYRVIDPDRAPEMLERYEVARRGAIVVEALDAPSAADLPPDTPVGRTNIIVETTEPALTQALMKVTQDKAGPICFVTGHGEARVTNTEEDGAGFFKRLLENENHDVREIVLISRAIPEDCSVLVVAGPDRELTPPEADAIRAFVEQDGKGLFLMPEVGAATGLGPWLESLGVTVRNDVIVEPVYNPFIGSQLGLTPVVVTYPPHEITRDMNQPTAFSLARSIATDMTRGPVVSPILKSSDEAWGETQVDKALGEQIVEKDDADNPGPLTMGVAIQFPGGAPLQDEEMPPLEDGPGAGGRVVLIGDSTFLRNGMIAQLYNNNLALNVIAWLAGKEENISVRAHEFTPSMMMMTGEERPQVFFVSVIGVPMLLSMLGIGVLVLRGRRSEQ
ncbi:GldG family protein [bacterium]|nr:GldG family protein [bacterium]